MVLLDMTLPGLSGREVLEAMRRIRPDVRVVLTTAYSQDTALTVLGGQPAWAYIQKPYQFNDLPRFVARLLQALIKRRPNPLPSIVRDNETHS